MKTENANRLADEENLYIYTYIYIPGFKAVFLVEVVGRGSEIQFQRVKL